jgi:hypothetical protein
MKKIFLSTILTFTISLLCLAQSEDVCFFNKSNRIIVIEKESTEKYKILIKSLPSLDILEEIEMSGDYTLSGSMCQITPDDKYLVHNLSEGKAIIYSLNDRIYNTFDYNKHLVTHDLVFGFCLSYNDPNIVYFHGVRGTFEYNIEKNNAILLYETRVLLRDFGEIKLFGNIKKIEKNTEYEINKYIKFEDNKYKEVEFEEYYNIKMLAETKMAMYHLLRNYVYIITDLDGNQVNKPAYGIIAFNDKYLYSFNRKGSDNLYNVKQIGLNLRILNKVNLISQKNE